MFKEKKHGSVAFKIKWYYTSSLYSDNQAKQNMNYYLLKNIIYWNVCTKLYIHVYTNYSITTKYILTYMYKIKPHRYVKYKKKKKQ